MQSDSDQSKPISICTYQTVFFLFYIVLSKAHRRHIRGISNQLAINLASSCTLYILCIYPVILNHHVHTQKKRDRNIAVPLVEALVLPFYPNSNTEPTPYVYGTRTTARAYNYTQHEHLVSQCFG